MEPMRMRLWIASRVTPSLSAASVTLSRSTESYSDTPHTPVYSHGCRVPQSGAWRPSRRESTPSCCYKLRPGGHRFRGPRSPRLILLISVSLLGALLRHLLLPLVCPLVAVRPLAQLLKLASGLGLAHGLERLFEGFPGPLGTGYRLPSQDLVCHVGH